MCCGMKLIGFLFIFVLFSTVVCWPKTRSRSNHSVVLRWERLTDLVPYNCNNTAVKCVHSVTDKQEYQLLPNQADISHANSISAGFEGIKKVKSYVDLADIPICRVQVLRLQSALRYFLIGQDNFVVAHELNRLHQTHSVLAIYKHLCHDASLDKTHKQIQIIKGATTEEYRAMTLVKYFYEKLPKVTNTAGTACYSTHEFLQLTMEPIVHVMGILYFISTSRVIMDKPDRLRNVQLVIKKLRELFKLQWRHVHSLCQTRLSYSVATTNVLMPCAKHIVPRLVQICQQTSPLIHIYSSSQTLHIGCNYTEILEKNCPQEVRDSHIGAEWYISSRMVQTVDPFRQYICAVAFGKHYFSASRHHLLYLNVSICELDNPLIRIPETSFTADLDLHHHIHFPFIFNPGPVGVHHAKPFYVTGMGLYVDELYRLAVNITTFKLIDKFKCPSSIPTFVNSHANVSLPDFQDLSQIIDEF